MNRIVRNTFIPKYLWLRKSEITNPATRKSGVLSKIHFIVMKRDW